MTTPRKLSSRYELGEILGFGGMSEVHLAQDLRLNRDVAIKVLRADLARDPTFYLRFRREAQNAAALNHPAIVAVYDTGEAETEAGPLPFIVMEYVEGDTLRDIVRTKGPFAPRRAMEVIADVCAALDFSHRNGIVHRDMKPANIMINRAGAVKVMDFGIARAIADSSSPMTQTAAVIGTAQYLSPEQARGEQVDARSDVYSVGCVLFEILTGEPPFKGDSPVAVAYQHVREDPPTPSQVYEGVPRELDSVILKAMSKNPANRYQTAAEMRSDLIRVLGGQRPSAPMVMNDEDRTTILGSIESPGRRAKAVEAAPTAKPETDEPATRKRWLRVAALVVVGIALVGLIGSVLWRMGPGSQADQVQIPNLAEKSALDAQNELEKLGFRVEKKEVFDTAIAVGKAVTTRPLPGTPVTEGSTVTLEVSKGPEQVPVPSLTGLTQEQAVQALGAVRLKLDQTIGKAPSSVADIGKIVEQVPSAGSTLKVDSVVKVKIGNGPEQIRVPIVVGQTIDVAKPNIEGTGFDVQVENVASLRPRGEVLSTTPTGGSQADRGSTVKVQVSDGSQFLMPNLVGMKEPDAVGTLKNLGYTGPLTTTAQGTITQPALDGIVANQLPAPGTPVGKNDPITVAIYKFGFN